MGQYCDPWDASVRNDTVTHSRSCATECDTRGVTLRLHWLTRSTTVAGVSRTGGTSSSGNYVVVQRKAGQVTDVWWYERGDRLYTFDEACMAAKNDNAHGDGYVSTVCEVFED